ncbi:MAG TPA: protein kinase [Kofleriaceae bacterium]|nr:protein kinase [Kofleriaceae bacterium]
MNAHYVEKHIGQYKILRTLGAGGMGTVYLGEHLLLGRRAAIKTLLPALSSHREIVDRFFNEARAISAISDPGVVQVFDFGYHVDGTAYIVMELLEGESLAARLTRLGTLPLVEALRLARQLSSSLDAAHRRDVVHRDLKPGNVFVIRDSEVQGGERAKILDFGICKLGDPEHPMTTQTGAMLGTPVYMSPEQCRGAGDVDHRSDIYSLGCVLFHMLTGRPPFDCEGGGEYIASHLKEEPPAPTTIAPELPPAIDALMALCLAKDPDRRFQSMAELQQAIELVLAQITETDSVAVAEPVLLKTPLGEGFQSAYDGNFTNRPPTPPAHSWFVDSLLPVSISDHYEVPRPRRWGRRLAYMLALVLGVVSGVAGTGYALDNEIISDVTAPPGPDATTPEELTPAYLDHAFEVAPADPIAIADAPHAPSVVAKQHIVAKQHAVVRPQLERGEAARVKRPRAITKPQPPRTRSVVRKALPMPQPEDPYGQ